MGEAKIRQMAKAPVLGDRPKFKDGLGTTIEQGDCVAWIVNGVKYRAVIEELVQPLVLADGEVEPGKIALRLEFPQRDAAAGQTRQGYRCAGHRHDHHAGAGETAV